MFEKRFENLLSGRSCDFRSKYTVWAMIFAASMHSFLVNPDLFVRTCSSYLEHKISRSEIEVDF